MFARLGSFAARFRWFIIAAWVVGAVALTLLAPNIDSVSVNDQRAFLPNQAPSLDASRELKQYFPDRSTASSGVVVVDAGKGNRVDAGAPWKYVQDLSTWLTGPDKPAGVLRITSPATADQQTAKALVSPDGQVALVVVNFTKIGSEPETTQALDAIEARFAAAPSGTTALLTGDAPIIRAYNNASRSSLSSTTLITILLVVLILFIVYRSPVSPIIPLFTIALAYLVSRGVVGILGGSVLTISGYTNIFLIVVLFGAGTDYCLFLISRFREEMAGSPDPVLAVKTTVTTVGETITSSAGTVIVGLMTLGLAELGLFNTSGPSVAIGVFIALVAGLTLTPAMLTILGDRAFWPRKASHMGESRLWRAWSGRITHRPLVALIVTLAVLTPLAIYGSGVTRDFDLLGDLSKGSSPRVGFNVLAEHFGPGVMQPVTVILKDPAGFTTNEGLARLEAMQQQLTSVNDVAGVRSFTSSLAGTNTLSVASQLGDQAKSLRAGMAALTQAQSSGQTDSAAVQKAVSGLLDLYSYVQQLGAEYPELSSNTSYKQALVAFTSLANAFGVSPATLALAATAGGNLPQLSLPAGGLPPAVPAALNDLATAFEGLATTFSSRPDAIMLPDTYVKNNEGLKNLKTAYISEDGTAARIQVILQSDPYSRASMNAVHDLRAVVTANGQSGVVEGSSAVVADLEHSSNRDMTRAIITVLLGILVVLIILLRALVAPLYLILTILLSYGATLGVVRLVFITIGGAAGITWWVPIFMFVMLVALGMDYNIFLMGRVKEEVRKSGMRGGVQTAVAKTGGIITSAGIIMAGTFAAMLSADLLGLVQLAFAVAFGILLDTFVVRTALVPAIAVLLDHWNWWPRKVA